MVDMFGTEIEVGDRVLFPTGANAGLGLKYGAVTSMCEPDCRSPMAGIMVKGGSSRWDKEQKHESYPRRDRIVVVDKGFYL